MSIYQQALDHFGETAQIQKAIEEMAELIVELSHFLCFRGDLDKVVEEVADAQIMLEQMKILFGTEAIKKAQVAKIKRLAARVYTQIDT